MDNCLFSIILNSCKEYFSQIFRISVRERLYNKICINDAVRYDKEKLLATSESSRTVTQSHNPILFSWVEFSFDNSYNAKIIRHAQKEPL